MPSNRSCRDCGDPLPLGHRPVICLVCVAALRADIKDRAARTLARYRGTGDLVWMPPAVGLGDGNVH